MGQSRKIGVILGTQSERAWRALPWASGDSGRIYTRVASHSSRLRFYFLILFIEPLLLDILPSLCVSVTQKSTTPNPNEKPGLYWCPFGGNLSTFFPSPSHPAFGSRTTTLRESQGGRKERRQLSVLAIKRNYAHVKPIYHAATCTPIQARE